MGGVWGLGKVKTYLLEVGPNGEDLVDQIFNRDDTIFAKVLLNEFIIREGNPLAIDFPVSALIHQFANALEVRLTIRNPRLDDTEHFKGGLGEADKHTVVDLEETEELEDFAWLRGNLVDTLDADDEDELGLRGDVEGAVFLGVAGDADFLTLGFTVLFYVLFGALEDDVALLFVLLGSFTDMLAPVKRRGTGVREISQRWERRGSVPKDG